MNKLNKIILILFFSIVCAQNFDPATGKLIQDSTKVQLKFDPVTGKQITKESQTNVVEKNLGFSNFEVVEKAKENAIADFEGFFWSLAGGPGSMWASSILGIMGVDFFDDVFFLPAMAGGVYFIPKVFSKINVNTPYYHKLYAKENLSNSQTVLYDTEYKKNIESLRLKAIRKGQLGTVGACAGFVFFMLIVSF